MRRQTIVTALGAALIGTLATISLYAQATGKIEQGKARGGSMMMSGPTITKAIAILHPTKSGGEAHGEVIFTKVDGGIRVEAEIRGLTPGKHGFHVHEFGDTSSPDAMSAGSHFNPMKSEHGAPTSEKRHVGDLGNLEASTRGVAKVDFVDPHLSFSGPTSIIGRGVIVHEKPDDFGQPVGNAGGRVAAGVIGVAKGS
jgi:Cu-Zn family superoxide dismutase